MLVTFWEVAKAVLLAPAMYVPVIIIAVGLRALKWRRKPARVIELDEFETKITE